MIKILITIIASVLFNCVAGATVGATVGLEPIYGAIAANAVAAFTGAVMPRRCLFDTVYTEIWTGEMVKKLRGMINASWLDGIPDMSSLVKNDVIHLVDVGADPDVLIDNSTYPLEIQTLPDGDIAISLSKFETKPTSITDDELYAISYDKMGRVRDSHSFSINYAKLKKAAHALCASSHTAGTPVISTTGTADVNGRKTLVKADLLNIKKQMDILGVPSEGRRLVLCPDHIQDILSWSEQFEKQYNLDNVNGKVGRLYGFDIYEFGENPYYSTSGVKKALGATPSTGEFHCSFAFYTERVFKATGSMSMYFSEASKDPIYHRNLIDFLQRFVCLPKKADAGVVIYSAYSSSDGASIIGDELIDDLPATAGTNNRTYATSNGAPVTATSNAAWLTATVAADGKKVTFTRQAYAYDAEGSSPRIGTVTIGISGTSVTKTVTVKQLMAAQG